MSNENESQSSQDAGSANDLSSALAGAEGEFVTGEEKKPAAQGMLLLLLLLAVGGGGTYFMYKRQGPSTAAAAAPDAAKAEETINSFLTSGPSGIKQMQDMLRDTEKVVKQFLEYPSVTQIPLTDLHTNPFRFAAKNESNSPDAEAIKRKKEEEKLAAVRASEALQLQSIIHSGSRKACMINNAMYLEGQQVEKFSIEKITPASVVVKTGVYRFELKMQK